MRQRFLLNFSKLSYVDLSSLPSLVSIKKCFDLASACLEYETQLQWQHNHCSYSISKMNLLNRNRNSKRVPQYERAKERKTQVDCTLCHGNLASTSYFSCSSPFSSTPSFIPLLPFLFLAFLTVSLLLAFSNLAFLKQRTISCRGVQFQQIISCPIPFTPLMKGVTVATKFRMSLSNIASCFMPRLIHARQQISLKEETNLI